MNLFLHNIGDIESDNFISPADALIAASPTTYDYVLANPPFGKKSSQTFTNDESEQEKDDLTYNRQDFWATTSIAVFCNRYSCMLTHLLQDCISAFCKSFAP